MKFYQIKSTEKDSKPVIWYRTLVPSGITFSQLYLLLGAVHGEFCLSPFFSFDCSKPEIKIEEFEDYEPATGFSSCDTYDSAGTYIDTLFEEGRSFCLITGADFDLTIKVEACAVEEDHSQPAIIGMSREAKAISGFVDGEVELLGNNFEIKYVKKRHFDKFEDLEAAVGVKPVIYASKDPVTPPESIHPGILSMRQKISNAHSALEHSGDKRLQELAFRLLLTPWYDSTSTALLTAEIDEILIPEYDTTFRMLMDSGETKLVKKVKTGANSQPASKRKPGSNTKTGDKRKPIYPDAAVAYQAFSKDELLYIASELGLSKYSSLNKKQLAERIAAEMLRPEVLMDKITELEDKEFELFERVAASPDGISIPDDADEAVLDDLADMLLVFRTRGSMLFMPPDLREVYEKEWDDSYAELREKRNWMYKCVNIAEDYYAIMTWDVLRQLFSRKYKNCTLEEIKRLFRTTPDGYNTFREVSGKLVVYAYLEDDYYKRYEKKVQGNKPFYIPSRSEIEEFYDESCLMSTPSYQAMKRFIKKTFGCDERTAAFKVLWIYFGINNEHRLQEIVDDFTTDPLSGEEFTLPTKKSAEEFIRLYYEMHSNTHMRANRGYTPNDLSRITGSHSAGGSSSGANPLEGLFLEGITPVIAPASPEAAKLLNESKDEIAGMGFSINQEVVDSMLANAAKNMASDAPGGTLSGEKRRKIGRNEPCPCGSGKKYKNCCGK